LKLDATTIASIFAGKINKWNAPAIKALNPGANLPSSSIATVHRSDSSGTSGAFTEYLSKTAPSVWTFGSNKTWPGPGGTGAKGSDGVTATVSQTSGAIGYAEVSYAVGANLPVVQVKNASGAFTSPKVASAVAATLAGVTIGPAGALTINYDTMNPAAYPIATPTYVVALKSGGSPLVKDFILYAVTQGQSSADQLFYAPLPQNLVSFAEQAINSMT
ncbi:MAG: extracellular solute-binding protein, partial [Acidimicrobiaceae bacterium]|nr:extracellular solute-binding protein [Acidimicrobiaceae bacterium]